MKIYKLVSNREQENREAMLIASSYSAPRIPLTEEYFESRDSAEKRKEEIHAAARTLGMGIYVRVDISEIEVK